LNALKVHDQFRIDADGNKKSDGTVAYPAACLSKKQPVYYKTHAEQYTPQTAFKCTGKGLVTLFEGQVKEYQHKN
jgi:hypothetical protein